MERTSSQKDAKQSYFYINKQERLIVIQPVVEVPKMPSGGSEPTLAASILGVCAQVLRTALLSLSLHVPNKFAGLPHSLLWLWTTISTTVAAVRLSKPMQYFAAWPRFHGAEMLQGRFSRLF
jgi:hypothetical protein